MRGRASSRLPRKIDALKAEYLKKSQDIRVQEHDEYEET